MAEAGESTVNTRFVVRLLVSLLPAALALILIYDAVDRSDDAQWGSAALGMVFTRFCDHTLTTKKTKTMPSAAEPHCASSERSTAS